MKTLSVEDQEYLKWLTRIECRAIIPLKWIILVVSLIVWFWSTHFTLPTTDVFMVFFLYAMFNMAQSYFFYARRVILRQIKTFCYISYFIDIIFVTLLIYLDTTRYYGHNVQSDFYILYFLMILRGFALFRRSRETIFMSLIISSLFIFTIWFRETSFDFMKQRTFALKFSLIGMVGLMSWFIVEMINSQKMELFRIRERLLRSEQFATLGQIAAGVAHEINNPIGIISAYSEYLIKNSSPTDPHYEDYQTLHKEALRCEKIISQLLNFANPTAREIVLCDLEKLNEEILKFVFYEKEEDPIKIEREIEENLPRILCDPIQIKQALLNIYINAKQAMVDKKDKKILVKLHKTMKDEFSISLVIRDTGPGIKKELLDKVLEPFFTLRKGGTGLGLSITRRIIEGHGGTIMLRNAPDCGTEVEITLPISP
jgi:signal transduction histidine kinase